MNKRLYNAMNWREIEGVLYGDLPHPEKLLGVHPHGKRAIVQAYMPGAAQLVLLHEKGETPMEEMDTGFFAAFLEDAKADYRFRISMQSGETLEFSDPYAFPPQLEEGFLEAFTTGQCLRAYQQLGAHPHKVRTSGGKTIKGTLFALWAPGADAVQLVVERFSFLMIRHDESGIFELFLPLELKGRTYRFRLRRGSSLMDRVDPFGTERIRGFSGVTGELTKKHPSFHFEGKSIRIRRVRPNGTESIKELVRQTKELGFTHLLTGFSDEGSLFAPDEERGKLSFYAELVRECHGSGLGILLDWRIDGFAAAREHFSRFDGTALFEHEDGRRGYRSYDDRFLYQYQSIQVRNYLLSGAFFLIEELGADGIYAPNLGSVLYLDYRKAPGEWLPNFMGENVDRDALSLIQECNQALCAAHPEALRLSDIGAIWKEATGAPEGEGLGFQLTSNEDFARDFPVFLSLSDAERAGAWSKLLSGLHYAFVEPRFLKLSRPDAGLFTLAAAFAMFSPGQKLFILDEIAPEEESYLKRLFAFWEKESFLSEADEEPESLAFINHVSSRQLALSFIRKGKRKKDRLFITVNFSSADRRFNFGVDSAGHYERIFSSAGEENVRYTALKRECDDKEYCVETEIAPYTLQVYRHKPFTQAEEKRFRMQALEEQIGETEKSYLELKRDRDAFLLEQRRILKRKEEAMEAVETELAALKKQLEELSRPGGGK